MRAFDSDEVAQRKNHTLAELEIDIELASLEADADERLRLGVLSLLRYCFDAKTTEAFNRLLEQRP